MARIFDLNIKNYRRFENFSYCFHGKNVICLAGRGDSGKSTILDAIAAVLSPAWNLSFYDNDFHDLNTEIPIEITATLIDIPDSWKVEDKFGLFYKGYDPAQNVIVEHYDGELLPAIKVCLSIDKTLEPSWEIVNDISGERANFKKIGFFLLITRVLVRQAHLDAFGTTFFSKSRNKAIFCV